MITLSIPEVMEREKAGTLFRKDMSDTDVVHYVRRHGRERLHAIPFAPYPKKLVEAEDLHRSIMSTAQREDFTAEYGKANYDRLPL